MSRIEPCFRLNFFLFGAAEAYFISEILKFSIITRFCFEVPLRFPPFFIGFSTIFWGFCAGWEIFSIFAALVFEAHNFIKTRFDLQKKDFIRISDLCSLVMLILLFYSYVENEPRMMFLGFITTLPIVFMPLLFAQLFSTSDKIVIGTTFGRRIHAHSPVDIRSLYILSILFATAASNIKSVWFVTLFMLIIFVALSGFVKDKSSFKRYLIFCFVAVFITVLIGSTVVGGHFLISRKMMEWYSEWYDSLSADPFKTSTSMGELGRMKLSGEIVFRVYPEKKVPLPLYMKQADYNFVIRNTWYARPRKTTSVFPDNDMEWQFFGEGGGSEEMKLSLWMGKKKGEGVLPLPDGAKRAVELDVAGIEKSTLGSIYVEEGPELLDFTITYDPQNRFEPLPQRSDLFIPKPERFVVNDVMLRNGLFGATPEETLENIERFFAGFEYTLELKNASGISVLSDFLNNTRAGHCEYFATAAVLMLRNAGIAARYRIGYMLDEYDTFEDALVARKRDAHAWVIAYIGDGWKTIDLTPPQWKSADSGGKSLFEPVSDFMSWIKMKYENYRRKKDAAFNRILIAVASVLTVFMMIRVYLRRRRVKKPGKNEIKLPFEAHGLDSPLYQMLDFYKERGMEREEYETLRRFLAKNRIDIGEIAKLHEELRFDTDADKAAVMAELLKKYEEWKKDQEF